MQERKMSTTVKPICKLIRFTSVLHCFLLRVFKISLYIAQKLYFNILKNIFCSLSFLF